MKSLSIDEESYYKLINDAVELSLEWGGNWLKDIEPRFLIMHPQITAEQAKILNKECKEIQNFSLQLFNKAGELKLTIDNAVETVKPLIQKKFPFLNEDNINKLVSQGMYYSLK